jgi:hypothetical protein
VSESRSVDSVVEFLYFLYLFLTVFLRVGERMGAKRREECILNVRGVL